jgi:hypothetical protein
MGPRAPGHQRSRSTTIQHSYDKEKYAALLKWERELRRVVELAVEGNVLPMPSRVQNTA